MSAKIFPWIAAARPKTLAAAFVPVMIGSATAFHEGAFHWGVFFAALLGATCIQIATNYVNDAADFEKGADNEDRLGPPRMALAGLLTPRALYIGAGLFFLAATLFGSYLIASAGWGILWIGLFSIFFAIIYTAGPFPLAYLGLGDLFVLIFFGVVAVMGTDFAHTHRYSLFAFLISMVTGLHSVSLIAVNNLRDIPTDIKAGKKTLSVRLGDRASRFYYATLVLLPFLLWIPVGISFPLLALGLPFLALPLAIKNVLECFEVMDRKKFNPLLGKSAALQLLFGILVAIALVKST